MLFSRPCKETFFQHDLAIYELVSLIMNLRILFISSVSVTLACCLSAKAETVTFDDLLGSPDTFFSGNTGIVNASTWTTGGVEFHVETSFVPFWSGWSQSNVVDSTTPNSVNQYASAPGGGSNGLGGVVDGGGYAVAFGDNAVFNVPVGMMLDSVDWTNGTYAHLSMLNGDAANGNPFPTGKKFGGASGTDPDFFRVDLVGYSGADLGGVTTGSVTLTLADFTDPDSANDFIINSWQVNEDLSPLGKARSVGLAFASSDVSFGFPNQPTYLVIDNLTLTAVPEPGGFVLISALAAVCSLRRRRSIK